MSHLRIIDNAGERKICREHRIAFTSKCPKCAAADRKGSDRRAVQAQIKVWEQVNGRPFYVS